MTGEGSTPALEARGLSKAFGAINATRAVTLALETDAIHAVIGPNGAGKTTLVAQLAGALRPDSGAILLDGEDITALDAPIRARAGIARSYQISSLFDGFTVSQHVELAMRGPRGATPMLIDRDGAAIRDAVRQHLARSGLEHLADTRASALAHGQRRQVELAMVTAADPRVVLLDEPMAGLGAGETREITPRIAELARGRAVLLVEHDMDVVFELASTVTVMVQGAVLASGSPEAVRADPAVRSAYLVESD